jgi:hypothetical protein
LNIESIAITLTSGTLGAVLGYLAKSLVDYYLTSKRMRSEKEWDQNQYRAEHFLIPLSKSLNRLANRMDFVAREKPPSEYVRFYGDVESRLYLKQSLLYEFCATCYWLQRIERDSKLGDTISRDEEIELGDMLKSVSGIPLYEQKSMGEAMTDDSANSFGPISYAKFKSTDYARIDGDKWEILFTLLQAPLAKEDVEFRQRRILSAALFLEQKADRLI